MKPYKRIHGKYKFELTKKIKAYTGIKGNLVLHKYFTLDTAGVLTIVPGYQWDGGTCAIDTHAMIMGSVFHDALYQAIKDKHLARRYRLEADQCLRDECLRYGMSRIRAWYVYRTVRAVGWGWC